MSEKTITSSALSVIARVAALAFGIMVGAFGGFFVCAVAGLLMFGFDHFITVVTR